ncbi:MAG: hypothetical protein ACO31I_19880 [Prochlorotrichaceae cyanobacterium]|jgi:hypothetical protein
MFKRLLGFPYFALLLMLLTYALFGWQWFERGQAWNHTWPVSHFRAIFWGLIILANLFVIGTMTAPLAAVRLWFLRLFQSDTRSFLLAIGFSFIGVVLVVYLSLTLEWMLLGVALMLARLELQDHQFNEWIAFWMLTIVALVGLALGSISHYYVPDFAELLSQWPRLR